MKYSKELVWFLVGNSPLIRSGAVVLTYHSIADNNAVLSVSIEMFERQMRYLRTNNWNVVTLASLVDYVKNQTPISKKTIVITFDDAYVNVMENALPILEKYDIPLTVFVPSGLVAKKIRNQDGFEFPVLDWERLRSLSRHPLVTIGSHTKTHPVLTEIEDQEFLRSELQESRETIREKLNVECNFFAYPKGKSNARVEREVCDFYVAAVGTRPGRITSSDDQIFELSRKGVYHYTSFSNFKSMLKV